MISDQARGALGTMNQWLRDALDMVVDGRVDDLGEADSYALRVRGLLFNGRYLTTLGAQVYYLMGHSDA